MLLLLYNYAVIQVTERTNARSASSDVRHKTDEYLQRASSPPRSVDINVYARLNVYEVVVWIGRRVVMLPLQINFNI